MAEGRRPPEHDYHLNESEPDVTVLRRQDGASVAAFSAGRHRRGPRGGGERGLPRPTREARVAGDEASGEGAVRRERGAWPHRRTSGTPLRAKLRDLPEGGSMGAETPGRATTTLENDPHQEDHRRRAEDYKADCRSP
jgi:hypothetical protein